MANVEAKRKWIQRWAVTRRSGRGAYLRRFAVLGGFQGLAMALLVAFGVIGHRSPGFALMAVISFPLMGVMFGWCLWTFNEDEFLQRGQRQDENGGDWG